jgi:hypothetical protein
MPNVPFVATSFPTTLPAANRAYAIGVCDYGIISLVHNATNGTPPNFLIYGWSDKTGYWYLCQTLTSLAAQTLGFALVDQQTPIYVTSSAPLTGSTSNVCLGGLTVQGNTFVPSAEV